MVWGLKKAMLLGYIYNGLILNLSLTIQAVQVSKPFLHLPKSQMRGNSYFEEFL